MTDSTLYAQLLRDGNRRISHRAMLTVLMISLYHQLPCFQQAYEMLRLLMDFDGLMKTWRRKFKETWKNVITSDPLCLCIF